MPRGWGLLREYQSVQPFRGWRRANIALVIEGEAAHHGLTQPYAEASPPRCAGSGIARTATSIDHDRASARLWKEAALALIPVGDPGEKPE